MYEEDLPRPLPVAALFDTNGDLVQHLPAHDNLECNAGVQVADRACYPEGVSHSRSGPTTIDVLALTQVCGPSSATLQEVQRLPLVLVNQAGNEECTASRLPSVRGSLEAVIGPAPASEEEAKLSVSGPFSSQGGCAASGTTSVPQRGVASVDQQFLDGSAAVAGARLQESSLHTPVRRGASCRVRGLSAKEAILQDAARRKAEVDARLEQQLHHTEADFLRRCATIRQQAERRMQAAEREIDTYIREQRSYVELETRPATWTPPWLPAEEKSRMALRADEARMSPWIWLRA